MALHIVNAPQPQAPWWAGFAERAILPMITSALERQRQRDENRKNNALIAKSIEDARAALGQAQPQIPMGQPAGIQGGNGWVTKLLQKI